MLLLGNNILCIQTATSNYVLIFSLLFASGYKRFFNDVKLFGIGAWFQVHRVLMTLTLVLTLIGAIIIFVYREGWSESAGYHAYLGVVVLGLVHCNLILGLLRPAIGTSSLTFSNRSTNKREMRYLNYIL